MATRKAVATKAQNEIDQVGATRHNSYLFDHYSARYDETLSNAIAPSGERREYFAQGRVAWLRRRLRELGEAPKTLLDYGCGDGSTTPLLLAALQAEAAIGVDVSAESLKIAATRFASAKVSFERSEQFQPNRQIDLAYCNGVFHHIPPAERVAAVRLVGRALRIGGVFAFWENNPWNPATRYVMSRCAFDKDAVPLTPAESRSLLRVGGFKILRTDFRFVFPRSLCVFRKLEDFIYSLPLGTQYLILCKKVD